MVAPSPLHSLHILFVTSENTCSLPQLLLSRLAVLAPRALPATQLAEAQGAVCVAGEEVRGLGSLEKNVLFTFPYIYLGITSCLETTKKQYTKGKCVLWRECVCFVGDLEVGGAAPQPLSPPAPERAALGLQRQAVGQSKGKGLRAVLPLAPDPALATP